MPKPASEINPNISGGRNDEMFENPFAAIAKFADALFVLPRAVVLCRFSVHDRLRVESCRTADLRLRG